MEPKKENQIPLLAKLKDRIFLNKAFTYVVMGLALILGISANIAHKSQVCKEVQVQFLNFGGNAKFMKQNDVLATATDDFTESLIGTKLSSIHLVQLENILEAHPYIRSAYSYNSPEGVLTLAVTCREPIIRVYDTKGNGYYLDSLGEKMPLSTHFAPVVPVATMLGDDTTTISSKDSTLHSIALALKRNPYIHALCGQLVLSADGEINIVPRVGRLKIEIGNAENADDKFARLEAFYKSALPTEGWQKYKSVSVASARQIVARY